VDTSDAQGGAEPGDWRRDLVERARSTILAAAPGVGEEAKWRKPANPAGVPAFSAGGRLICTVETYRDKVKLTFARGASLPDPQRVFNAGLAGRIRRAIDLREGDPFPSEAVADLVRAAAAAGRAAG